MEKSIEFNGVKYSLVSHNRYYLSQSNTNAGRRGAKSLHVAVWEFYSGKTVPNGFVVHHKDGDYSNNNFENLECISANQHYAEHKAEKSAYGRSPHHLKHLQKIRKKATAWHKSSEGRAWHSTQAYINAEKIFIPRDHYCQWCFEIFTSNKPGTVKYCSELCRDRGRRDSIPVVFRQCQICGKDFKTKTAATCSRNCRQKLAYRNRAKDNYR